MEDVTTELLDELMILSGCGVRDLYQREAGPISRHRELLPVVIAFLRRIAKGGAWNRSPMQYQDKLLDTAALAEALLQISQDVRERMNSVTRKATPVMTACRSHLSERRGVLSYWLREEERNVRGARTSLAELTHLYWRSQEDWHGGARPEPKRSWGNSPVEQPDALAELDSLIMRSATHLITLLERAPGVLFEPGSRIPVAIVDSLSPDAFELLVSALLERDGFTVERATGRSGDSGADCIAIGPMGLRFAVQVKHTKDRRNIGPDPARKLVGTLRDVHKADIAMVVTNGGFTKTAHTEAHTIRVHLVGQFRLERWAERGESLIDVLSSRDAERSGIRP